MAGIAHICPRLPQFLGRNYQHSVLLVACTQEQLDIFGRNYQSNDRDIAPAGPTHRIALELVWLCAEFVDEITSGSEESTTVTCCMKHLTRCIGEV